LGSQVEDSQVLQWIDHGRSDTNDKSFWTVDPIDGTKGFLRHEQYSIALAGNPAQCFTRRKRSSSTAETNLPSTTTQAEESP